ncbi:MAG: phage integrase SAM-like domain-containing protein [Paraprevotella sp.]|nr:phage integrase SAM-like domain-containing protein [Paraprevotella sp.]MBP3472874.1 phage integrase SAM-like domain-containing protein [Paraprevotella sp.]
MQRNRVGVNINRRCLPPTFTFTDLPRFSDSFSKTTYQAWCRFDEINVGFCNRFREYLMTAPQTIHTEHKLHINSVVGYWSTFRAVLHTAYREHKIMENPNGF